MRVLFTCAAEYGHLHPHLPLARALACAGHDVAFALPDAFRSRVQQAGFQPIPVGLERAQLAREIAVRFPEWPNLTPGERLRFAIVSVGAGIVAPAMLPELVAAIRDWGAELLVHGPAVFAGPLAAVLAGIPSVNQSWGPLLPLEELRLAADAVAPLWRREKLDPPVFAGMFQYLYLDASPPALQRAEIQAVPVAHPLRPVPFDAVGDEALPAWVGTLPDRPTVCVTMGTFFNQVTRIFSAVLDGLRDEPLNVIVTTGYDQDPAVLGPQPDHIKVERYIPLSLLLPHCDAVVTHGGSGSVLAALSHGRPVLVIPQGADQFQNADACVASGAGRCLVPELLDAHTVRREVASVLHDPAHRDAARRVQNEIAAMPQPEEAVGLLEELQRRPRRVLRSHG